MGKVRQRLRRASKIAKHPIDEKEKSHRDLNVDDNDDEWAKIEEEQRDDGDESDDDDIDEDEADDIGMDGSLLASDKAKYSFDFNVMSEEHAEGITVLLKSILKNPSLAYDLALRISKQITIGTAITSEEEVDVFAFATVLPLREHLSNSPISLVLNSLLSSLSGAAGEKKEIAFLTNLLSRQNDHGSDNNVGLLLHRKYLNLPMELIGPLHSDLSKDVLGAVSGFATCPSSSSNTRSSSSSGSGSNMNNSESNMFRDMKHVVLLTTGALLSTDSSSTDKQRKKQSGPIEESGTPKTEAKTARMQLSRGRAVQVCGPGRVTASPFFDLFEDDVYFRHARCGFAFVSDQCPDSVSAVIALAIEVAALNQCAKEIGDLCAANKK